MAAGDRRLRRRDQSGRPQRQLPLQRRESRGDPGVARAVDARGGQAIARGGRPPRVWLQASTATIYAHRYDARTTSDRACSAAASPGRRARGDSASTSRRRGKRAFEEAVTDANSEGRAPVGDNDEPGSRRRLRHAARPRPPRPGRQRGRRPAVHVVDSLRGFRRGRPLADRSRRDRRYRQRRGTESAAERRIHADTARGVRRRHSVCRRRGWMLEIGAVFMRTETELILKSRRVVPGRLLEHGFKFKCPEWRSAATELCHRRSISHAVIARHETAASWLSTSRRAPQVVQPALTRRKTNKCLHCLIPDGALIAGRPRAVPLVLPLPSHSRGPSMATEQSRHAVGKRPNVRDHTNPTFPSGHIDVSGL